MLTNEEVMEILEKSNVLLKGHFILTSGRHSATYMQMAQVLQYPEYAEKLCSTLATKFSEEKIDIVVAPAVGGILVGYETARAIGAKSIFAERENGIMKLRRGFAIEKGEKVLVVEDVTTTGGSVKEVISLVEELGGKIVGVGALVDRSNGKIDFGYPFHSLISLEIISYEANVCPLCQEGIPAVKPGSRDIKK